MDLLGIKIINGPDRPTVISYIIIRGQTFPVSYNASTTFTKTSINDLTARRYMCFLIFLHRVTLSLTLNHTLTHPYQKPNKLWLSLVRCRTISLLNLKPIECVHFNNQQVRNLTLIHTKQFMVL